MTLSPDPSSIFTQAQIYTDLNPSPATRWGPALHSITEVADTAPHRNVDLEILKADQAGVIKSYTILPSTIWGFARGEVFEKGLSHPTSQQMPQLVEIAIKRKRAGVVGKGKISLSCSYSRELTIY